MPQLAAALRNLTAALHTARDRWWVIGSAAARLHGVKTSVADVDVLLSRRDAHAVMSAWPAEVALGTPSNYFRSSIFARLSGAALPIELMAGLEVCASDRWIAVMPRTREEIGAVYVPEAEELAAIFTLFGREKDVARAAAVRAVLCATGRR
jgi:hypothetical protein